MPSETSDKEKLDGKEMSGLKTHRNYFFYWDIYLCSLSQAKQNSYVLKEGCYAILQSSLSPA